MSHESRAPSRDELLAMAYVDGELASAARVEFEGRLRSEPKLVREVAELKQLAVLARSEAPPEPMDFEWERLEAEWLHAGGHRLGFLLLLLAGVGGAGWFCVGILTSDMALFPKLLSAAGILGVLVLFCLTLRARLRTLPYDPYTQVKR